MFAEMGMAGGGGGPAEEEEVIPEGREAAVAAAKRQLAELAPVAGCAPAPRPPPRAPARAVVARAPRARGREPPRLMATGP